MPLEDSKLTRQTPLSRPFCASAETSPQDVEAALRFGATNNKTPSQTAPDTSYSSRETRATPLCRQPQANKAPEWFAKWGPRHFASKCLDPVPSRSLAEQIPRRDATQNPPRGREVLHVHPHHEVRQVLVLDRTAPCPRLVRSHVEHNYAGVANVRLSRASLRTLASEPLAPRAHKARSRPPNKHGN